MEGVLWPRALVLSKMPIIPPQASGLALKNRR